MLKPLEEMTREELIEYAKDCRKTLTELHIRFLRGLVMELEYGDIRVTDIDTELRKRLHKILVGG